MLDVSDQPLTGVVDQLSVRQRLPGAALIKKHDALPTQVEPLDD